MHAIRVSEPGTADVLEVVETAPPIIDENQVLVRVQAVGVNFIDVYHRRGVYGIDVPFMLGIEGAGPVEEAGADVSHIGVGDRVAWSGVLGSYAEQVAVPADRAVRVPGSVGPEVAVALMTQGVTAHYLSHDTHALLPGDKCLVHAGAGGVGHLLIQLAKMRGAEVFATVSTDEKAALAREAGAHVLDYAERDFGDQVEEIAGPKALDVVYDGVGKATLGRGLELLRPRGMMVTFGQSSGFPEPVDPGLLNMLGSLYLTRPSIAHYVTSRHELETRTKDLFDWVSSGDLKVTIGARFPLARAADAHRALEGRQTTGKVVLEP